MNHNWPYPFFLQVPDGLLNLFFGFIRFGFHPFWRHRVNGGCSIWCPHTDQELRLRFHRAFRPLTTLLTLGYRIALFAWKAPTRHPVDKNQRHSPYNKNMDDTGLQCQQPIRFHVGSFRIWLLCGDYNAGIRSSVGQAGNQIFSR